MPERTLFFGTALLPEGWRDNVRIAIEGGTIESTVAGSPPAAGDERHAIGLPGIANVHSHAFQRAMAGFAEYTGEERDDFWTWREAMYRVALSVSPEDVEAIATQLYVEMLESGFTRVGEFHYLHHDRAGQPYSNVAEMAERILAAASMSGIGMTLLPVFYAHGNFGGAPPTEGQRRFVTHLDGFADLLEASRKAAASLDGANVGIAPHSLRAVTPPELFALLEASPTGPVHIHAAEQQKEVDDSLALLRAAPVEWLLDNANVDSRWCLIHATHMDSRETKALAESGATAGLCPITEANLGDGIFPGRPFIEDGGRYGVGTDSNILVDAAAELRQLEYAQRLDDRARNRMAAPGTSTGRMLFDAAVSGGCRALGQGRSGLVPGAPADIVSLASDHLALQGRRGDRILDAWIFAARDSPVDCVWARGVRLVEGGRHRQRDTAREKFRAAMRRLAA